MKIAILSDFHLGYERFREDAFRQAKEALEKAALAADALLIPGDIFDIRNPKPETLAEAINLFRDLSSREWQASVSKFEGRGSKTYAKAPIIAIAGTHERRAQDMENPVGLLNLAGLLVDVSQASVEIRKGSEVVYVYGLGGIDDERFVEAMQQSDPKPRPDAFSIFMFHESLYELLPFNERFAKFGDLPKGFDLYVCGHIHSKADVMANGKPLLIPGSTVLTQLKDGEQEPKGFWVFDTADGSRSFNHINSRKFYCINVDVDSFTHEQVVSRLNHEVDLVLARGDDRPIIRIALRGEIGHELKEVGLDLHQVMKKYKDNAVIEISKTGMVHATLDESVSDAKGRMMDNTSIKDVGLGIFMERYRSKKAELKMGAAELFELLGSDGSRDKIIRAALEELLA